MLRYIFTIVLSLCLVQSSTESQVSLTAEPGVINVGLTDTLTLTCSVQDESTSEDTEASSSSSTSFDIAFVYSIIVFRGSASAEIPVARIIRSNSAEAVADEKNLQVTGDVNPARPSDPEFLKLVWTRPSLNQSGLYRCEIYALDTLGRGVVLKAKADVKSEAPGNEELIAEIVSLKNITSTLGQTINEMKSVLKPPHTEQGVVECSSYVDNWGSGELSKTVQFEKPYVDVPVVSVSAILVDLNHEYNTRWSIVLSDVSKTGFKVTCVTWADSYMYGLNVRWTSIVA